MMANFEASKISIKIALRSIPINPPTNETTKAFSTPLSLNSLEIIFLARLNMLENIKIKERKPKIPISPKSRKKSLSVASVIEE